MIPPPVRVPGPIALVYSDKFLADLEYHPTPFFQELDTLAKRGALPLTLEKTQKGWRMAVYAGRHVGWLYPTRAGDAYNLGHAARRRFRDEERLLKGALLLSCPGICAVPDLASLNRAFAQGSLPRTTTYGDALWSAWTAATAAAGRPAPDGPSLAPAHARYLDLVDQVIEAGRQIEIDQLAGRAAQAYVHREAAKEQRHSARGVYRFRMARRPELTKNTMVYLGDAPQLRGRVIDVDGRDVVVRFEPGADYDQIGAQGTLGELGGDRIFRAQRDAVAALRKGSARNPHLLEHLVDARFRPYEPARDAVPAAGLDDDQREAFRRAVAVPDLLAVLGPPGTGKTRTIVQVVQECAARGQRVLVTSHTHRAVDNVLEDLPPELNVVRIGNEDRMSAKVRALSSESRAEALRQEILADRGRLDALREVRGQRPLIERYLAHLESVAGQGAAARAELDAAPARIAAAVRAAGGPLAGQLDAVDRDLAAARAAHTGRASAAETAGRRLASARGRVARNAPPAFLHRWIAGWLERRAGRAQAELVAAGARLAAAESARSALWQRITALGAQDPEVVRLYAAQDAARRTLEELAPEPGRIGKLLRQLLRPATTLPPDPPDRADGPDWAGWEAWRAVVSAAAETAERQANLLGEWRERVADLGGELEREIARYCDVVGATCIGTDTSALVSQLDFDLAIVDEAGQISTPNLLVPLVRARRAMLVGDHRQLPPFLDEEVRRWAGGLAADVEPAVTDLLARSGFELLFPRAPQSNAVWLRTQRRMPEQIAGFVSERFYSGRVTTRHAGGPAGDLFASPFAMVDTSDRPAAQRAETAMRNLREAVRHGYRNELEADLIVALLRALRPQFRDWAVIVPFNAQKELLIERLGEPATTEHVGSVDSFQGGERDLVVFGFTRSNAGGDIGFLRELRRFNVAITRARRQLVLVGDLSTLRAARDEPFRELMVAMGRHLAGHGDRRDSLEIAAALANTAGRRP
ncbi:AAA domain-containing protein [Dactylosporangium sp. NPDC000244]|uniref:DEAD/DEAH box helicase n=1 Tax=Dactylosporangium sp. NPDC000244 TaxID=3154365 RepID=UPI00332B1419